MIRRVASRGLAQSRPARGYAPAAPVSPALDRIAGTRARAVQVSGKNIMPDEIIDELNLSWEGKHDRWAGYGPVSPKPAPSTGCRPADPSLPAAATLPVARSTHARTHEAPRRPGCGFSLTVAAASETAEHWHHAAARIRYDPAQYTEVIRHHEKIEKKRREQKMKQIDKECTHPPSAASTDPLLPGAPLCPHAGPALSAQRRRAGVQRTTFAQPRCCVWVVSPRVPPHGAGSVRMQQCQRSDSVCGRACAACSMHARIQCRRSDF
jgi:hypothetical protein